MECQTCLILKTSCRGQIVAEKSCRDVYAGTPSSTTCMPVHPRRRRVCRYSLVDDVYAGTPSSTTCMPVHPRRRRVCRYTLVDDVYAGTPSSTTCMPVHPRRRLVCLLKCCDALGQSGASPVRSLRSLTSL